MDMPPSATKYMNVSNKTKLAMVLVAIAFTAAIRMLGL